MQVPVHTQRRQIVHLDLSGINTKPWPIVTAFRDHYMVPWPDAHVAVGATHESRVGFVPKMTVGGVMELLDEALRVTPGFGTASIREVHVGLRPLAVGGVPVIGRISTRRDFHVATGHGSGGLQTGLHSKRVIAPLSLGYDSSIDFSAFSIERFQNA